MTETNKTNKEPANAQGKITPSVKELWQGAILATIAHALFITASPDLAYELSWEGLNYSRQDSQGGRGTITFTEDEEVVGAFFDTHSPRNPYLKVGEYTLAPYFKGIPENLLQLAQSETLEYILDDWEGKPMPVVTSAFWSVNGRLVAAEDWTKVLSNGAHLLRIELMPIPKAFSVWQSECDFSEEQIGLVQNLYKRKLENENQPFQLEREEYKLWTAQGTDGIIESRELLEAIRIVVPFYS